MLSSGTSPDENLRLRDKFSSFWMPSAAMVTDFFLFIILDLFLR